MSAALFDILIVSLFIGGCVLLWLNFRPREEQVSCSVDEKTDLNSECRPEEIPVARTPEQGPFHLTAFPDDAQAENLSIDTAAVQNHYAASVSAALARSRMRSGVGTVRKVDG
jgi:hypothetical protein